jgi:hypothetical protein
VAHILLFKFFSLSWKKWRRALSKGCTKGKPLEEGESPYQLAPNRETTVIIEQVCLHWSCRIFLGEENLVKSWLVSNLNKVIYFKGTILQRSTKSLFTTQNRLEIS